MVPTVVERSGRLDLARGPRIIGACRPNQCLKNLRLFKFSIRLTRRDLLILIGLLTGHADLSRRSTLMKVRLNPTCPFCQEEEETALHLLGRCSALAIRAARLLYH